MIGAATTTSSGFNPLSIFSILQYPFIWVLDELVKVFTAVGPLKAIGAFGLSVMVLTIAIRAVLFPIFGWQLKTSRRIQAEQRLVAPQLQELRKKYKNGTAAAESGDERPLQGTRHQPVLELDGMHSSARADAGAHRSVPVDPPTSQRRASCLDLTRDFSGSAT